jgi:hypothetical protein
MLATAQLPSTILPWRLFPLKYTLQLQSRCRAYAIMRCDRASWSAGEGARTVALYRPIRVNGETRMHGSFDTEFTGKRARS